MTVQGLVTVWRVVEHPPVMALVKHSQERDGGQRPPMPPSPRG